MAQTRIDGFDEYQLAAERTARRLGYFNDEVRRLADFTVSLAGAAVRVAAVVKSAPLDREALVRELGSVLWHVAVLASTAALPLSEVAATNVRDGDAR